MKNLTSLIKENNETKKYKYTATVTVEGNVTAMSEGDAGELVDKEIDTIPNVVNYEISTIEEIENEVTENVVGNSDDTDVDNAYNAMLRIYTDAILDMKPYHEAMLNAKLRMFFDKK